MIHCLRFLAIIALYLIIDTNANADESKIKIVGNQRVEADTILANIDFDEKNLNSITDDKINSSIKKLYATGYFSDVSITHDDLKSLKQIQIHVIENPIINDVFFTGDAKLGRDEVKKELLTKERGSLSRAKVKGDIDRLYGTYQKMGYLNIQIEPKIIQLPENRVDVIFDINEGSPSHVSKIVFSGNNKVSDDDINDVMLLKEKGWNPFSSASKFEEDKFDIDKDSITKLYLNKGYADFKILSSSKAFSKKDFNFILTFFLSEGDKYKFNNINIVNNIFNLKTDISKLEKAATIKKNDTFSQIGLQSSTSEITNVLAQEGYNSANIDIDQKLNHESNTVDVNFIIREARRVYINKILISGNVSTKHNVILREMEIHEGDLYDSNKIAMSKDRLQMLGYFKKLEFIEKPVDGKDLIDIEIEVEEQFFGSVNFSFGYSSFGGILGGIQASVNNIFGTGYSGSIGFSRSGFMESYNLSAYDPYIIEKYRIGLGFSASYSRFGDLGLLGTSAFRNMFYSGEAITVGLNSGFEIINRLTYGFGFAVSQNKTSLPAGVTFDLYQQLMGSRNAYILSHSVTWNKMNRARYATSGYMIRYGENYAVGGQQSFIARKLNISTFTPILEDDLVLEVSFDGGSVQKTSDSQVGIEHLYTLGYYKMRGFSYFGVGPRIGITRPDGSVSYMSYAVQAQNYYVGTIELSSPLLLPKEYGIKFGAFVDIGSAWGFPGTQTQSYTANGVENIYDTMAVRVSAGVGLIWQSPMGEMRFDYAIPLIKQPYDTPMQINIRLGNMQF